MESLPITKGSDALDSLLSTAKKLADGGAIRDEIVSGIYGVSAGICGDAVTYRDKKKLNSTYKLDNIVTSKIWGFPIMLAILGVVFWITIAGANYPSSWLATFFGFIEGYLTAGFEALHAPAWLHGVLVLGLYRGTSWVISVMLPPMMIFFPVFALLENFGYLPRVAFNMDRLFKKSGGHGKQALTMSMGFGCNAFLAILSTRIIESPRERMLAILTNNFVPCNGSTGHADFIVFLIYGRSRYDRCASYIHHCLRPNGDGSNRHHCYLDCFLGHVQNCAAWGSHTLHIGASSLPPSTNLEDHTYFLQR